MQYDVFISCKSEDYQCAEEIYEFLEANGIHTFLASKELRKLGDSEYRKAISKALKSAYHMIVFASQAEYIDTTWVYYEWDWFINAKLKGFKPGQIVTILKDVNVDDVNSDLWKYESFVFSNYKEGLLSYVETPAYLQRKEEEEKRKEEEERARRQQEEEKRKRKEARDKLIAMAEDYRGKVANLHSVDAKKIVSVLRTMGITAHSCPVCKTEVDVEKTYCPTCGWTISPIDDIEGADYLSLINQNQLEVVAGLYEQSISFEELLMKSQNLLEENEKLQIQVSVLTEQYKNAEVQFKEVTHKHSEVLRVKKEMEQSHRNVVAKVQTLEQKNANIQKEQLILQTRITEQQKQLIDREHAERQAKEECTRLRKILAEKESSLILVEKLKRESLKKIQTLMSELAQKEEELVLERTKRLQLQQSIDSQAVDCYNVVLRGTGAAKLQVVKAVKEALGMDLKESKELVDNAPTVIAWNVDKHLAMKLKHDLEESGGSVELEQAAFQQSKALNSILPSVDIPDNKIELPTSQYKKVDLGLSVCWAEHNVGASSPEKYGDYFAWGETGSKSEYKAETNKYYDKTKKTYIHIGKDISVTKYDVARAQWGGNWRMPRLEEIKELIDKCSWQWTELKGINGYKVTGPNGNSIFLPAAGYRFGTEVYSRGSRGYYWSGALNEDYSNYAYHLYFYSDYHDLYNSNRYYGLTVRPVTEY